MAEKENPIVNVASITSDHDRKDFGAYAVDLNAANKQHVGLNDSINELTVDQKFYILKRMEQDNLEDFDDLPPSGVFMIDKVAHLDINEAEVILKDFLKEHRDDVNISIEYYDFVESLALHESSGVVHGPSVEGKETSSENEKDVISNEKDEAIVQERSIESDEPAKWNTIFDWELQARAEAALIAYWSPYPEVRAVTDPFDDPETPCETVRVYFLGLIWVILGTFIGQYFSERQPGIGLGSKVVQLFIFPMGKFLATVLPAKKFKVWKWTINLNPGPWSHKEQMLTTLFYSVSGGGVYASYFIVLQKLELFYNNPDFDFGGQILLVLASNFMGFGLAGIFRKFVVYPVTAVWPTLLPTLAVNKALTKPEKKENINGWKISRFSFFFIVFGCSFVYFWIPNVLFSALTYFNWISWAAPDNFNVATITGSFSGLGLNPITSFDFNIIGTSGFIVPFFAYVNNYLGIVSGLFVIAGLWWTNYKWTAYLPINSNRIFTNKGKPYSVTAVLGEDKHLDPEKYAQVGPPFYSAANLVVYGTFLAMYPLNFFYVMLTNFDQIKFAMIGLVKSFDFRKRRSTYDGFDDPFSVSMKRYAEVPEWWFTIILVLCLVFAIINVQIYDLHTPVWTIFFALVLNFVFLLPFVIVYAATGSSLSINVLLEMIIGYALPGNGTALNFVKTLGTNIDAQAENYITNQKQAHYWRIPPRSLFRVQMLSVLVNSFVAVGTINLVINSVENLCSPLQPQRFTCPGSTTFYSASVFWGVIGPKKVFGGLYPIFQWCFLIGFLLVFPCWALKRYFGRTVIGKYFHPILFTFGFMAYAPYNLSYSTPGLYVSIAFMYYIRKKYTAWWEKYNYILASGIGGGIAFSAIIIFFAVHYHGYRVSWWGNTVNSTVLDYTYPVRLNVTEHAPDGYFGPRVGNFP
ncbi:hypothetical protein FT663_02439 [Candidozyma haemuli var. vulneris]|uniref:OPT family small oligopeptide transporter n=1 Tax=Candidozyma haemuli TaxID=45357 RepID=A0A2V1ANB8_9ASCO|nr:OPT family small oligopeptide transporter [[Candida] haemuloni]KAF3992122.1 hypothetical protein FT663_02439 [[Candida] haemuloni var. vulneris]KAF3992740.1 hypothetical protein FT662_00949 [[Candida] haemuloni var. vulneris]PVH19212.1 OPT family small oligopeptide transporter [[Candida] haemuloni]